MGALTQAPRHSTSERVNNPSEVVSDKFTLEKTKKEEKRKQNKKRNTTDTVKR